MINKFSLLETKNNALLQQMNIVLVMLNFILFF